MELGTVPQQQHSRQHPKKSASDSRVATFGGTGAAAQPAQQQRGLENGNNSASERGDNAEGQQQQHQDEEYEALKYGASHVIHLFVPVSLCMAVVILTVASVGFYSEKDGTYLPYTPFHSDTDHAGIILAQSLGNALIMLGLVIMTTIVLVVLYYYRFYKVIHGWLILTTFGLLTMFSFSFILELFKNYNIPLDYPTLILFLWNWCVLGMVCIHWKGPLLLQQFYLICVSALMALIFIKYLPDWTVWTVLAVLSIWDLVAVLCPKGPLRILVETTQERNEPIVPALIYSSTILYSIDFGIDDGTNGGGDEQHRQQQRQPNDDVQRVQEEEHQQHNADDDDGIIAGRRDGGDDDDDQAGNGAATDELLVLQQQQQQQETASTSSSGCCLLVNNTTVTTTGDDAAAAAVAMSSATATTTTVHQRRGRSAGASDDSANTLLTTVLTTSGGTESRTQTLTASSSHGGGNSARAAAPTRSRSPRHPASERAVPVAAADASNGGAATEERGVKLGLGDFIFYSVLVGKASSFGDWNVTIACYVAILVGLSFTLMLLALFRKALPALPISIFFGIIFFFATRWLITPFLAQVSVRQILL